MNIEIVTATECEPLLNWQALMDAFEAGHLLPKAEIGDTFLHRGPDTLLSRSAWIDGMGIAVKSATIFPKNADSDQPTVNGGVSLYNDRHGTLEALIDYHMVTKWKTAADSLLAAKKLARPDPRLILIIGAGTVARSLIEAYGATFPDARISIWNRSKGSAARLAKAYPAVAVITDLEPAVRRADIISCATMSTVPVLQGDWLKPGHHIDLIGAFRPDMRETDDAALRKARIFVDSRATTLDHIGELKIPLDQGVINRTDILADFYDLASGAFARNSENDITLFKNGGGAHLDLITSRYILNVWNNR